MPPTRCIKNTSATVFFATLLLCVGVNASDISPEAPAELFGLKIKNHCKDLGQSYLDLKRFLEIGSGRKDILNRGPESQCLLGNPSFKGGYQSEIYRRENNGRSEKIELYFTPDMKLWRIDLNTTWDASDGPSRKTTVNSLLQRFGSPILIRELRSAQNDRPDEEVFQHYAARWSTRTALKKQVDASVNMKSCTPNWNEQLRCMARANSLWDSTINQLGGIVTDVSVKSVGRAERTERLWISIEDITILEKYNKAISPDNKKLQKDIEEHIKKLDKEKVPDF